MDEKSVHFETLAIHAGQRPDPTTGALMTPVYLTSTYAQDGPGEHKGFEYSRTRNPTRDALEGCLSALEGATHALAFASGLAAADALLHLLDAGDHVLASDDGYGGTFRLFDKVFRRLGLEFSFADMSDPGAVERGLRKETRLVWIESPTNPLLKVVDLATLAGLARAHGARTVVDNTFATPFFQRPLEHGIDLVTHSTTKYLNGHSDLVGGAIMTNDGDLHERLRFLQNAVGAVPSPFDSFLVLRGLKTLHVRMERHAFNAMEIARFLERHPQVEQACYPGLPSHPQHALAMRQMKGFGGMLTFVIRGGLPAARALLKAVRIFACAESLGGVESLIEHPAIMTHASLPPENRRALGIADGFIRVSCGIENVEDLIADLERGFSAARNAASSGS
ncbi:MAG TPA: cystathionine gamma-synthase [Anaeromyxobacteraceae bacterium]|nr:cystathionine gamma-synthase [Anaeromyxobacteraceae bacterium]